MRHEDDLMSGGVADRDLPFLSAGVKWIQKGQRQWAQEDRRRFIERYAVLLEVGFCLRRMPLVDHRFSLPQRSSRTGSFLRGHGGAPGAETA